MKKLFNIGLFLIVLSGCSQSPAGRIERVLNRCTEISKEASKFQDPAAQAGYVADAIQGIDTSRCPPDFRVAFQEHINAWRHAESAYSANTFGNNILEGALAAITENPQMIGQTAFAAGDAFQHINATYYRLVTIATAHGARVPLSVVD